MLVSGYYDGKLKFIVEFDYRSANFYKQLSERVTKALPKGIKRENTVVARGFPGSTGKTPITLGSSTDQKKFDSTMMTKIS